VAFNYEKALAHFAAQRQSLTEIKIPEWECSIFYYPVMSFEERAAIASCFQNDGRFSAETIIESLMQRARDENGVRLFRPVARDSLRKEYDPQILERIVLTMNENTDAGDEVEERKKP
jgi:hypothetical protein